MKYDSLNKTCSLVVLTINDCGTGGLTDDAEEEVDYNVRLKAKNAPVRTVELIELTCRYKLCLKVE